MGIAKLSLNELEPEISKEIELSLLASLDTLKVKDKKDRGSLTIKVSEFLDAFPFVALFNYDNQCHDIIFFIS